MHFFSLAVFCFSCLLVVPGLMHAQDPCPGILRNGVWEYQSSQGSDNQTSSFLSWFCSKDFKSSKEASESGGALGIPIGDIPVSLSGYTRDTQWSEYRNEACSTSSAKYNHLSDFSNFTSKASTAVVSAWLGCVNREGVKAYLTTSSDLKAFTITIQRTTSLGKPEFTLSQIAVTSGKLVCSPTLASAKGKTYLGSASFLCEREDVATSFTVLPIVDGLVPALPSLSVPGYTVLPPSPKLPPVQTKVFTSRSTQAGHPEVEVKVDAGYKVIGCGARANSGANLLTAIYPDEAANVCRGRSKDHRISDPTTIDVWAIGLYDPNDKWDVRVFNNSSSVAGHASATVSVPYGYAMTGGGADTNYAGAGNMLTANYPISANTWEARSMDHYIPDTVSLKVYAVGIKPRDSSLVPQVMAFSARSSQQGHPSQEIRFPSNDFVLTSGGAFADYHGAGNMLIGSFPLADGLGWSAGSADHSISDPTYLTVYALGIKK